MFFHLFCFYSFSVHSRYYVCVVFVLFCGVYNFYFFLVFKMFEICTCCYYFCSFWLCLGSYAL